MTMSPISMEYTVPFSVHVRIKRAQDNLSFNTLTVNKKKQTNDT